jgi:hypothetical protein
MCQCAVEFFLMDGGGQFIVLKTAAGVSFILMEMYTS